MLWSGFLFGEDSFPTLPTETVEEQLQGLMCHDAWYWSTKVRLWQNLSASLYVDVTWKERNEVWLIPLVCVMGDPLLSIGIVIDVFRTVYYISLHDAQSRYCLFKALKNGNSNWVHVNGDWIVCPGINGTLLVTAFCFKQIRTENGFVEGLIKMMRHAL